MGSLCSCCRGDPKESAEERAKMSEAQAKAGLAAQQRMEAFEKSAAGRAAKKVAAELAKPPPPLSRGEPALRWQVG
ncbi:hypothetical protein MPTK1_2g21140 [Marchantia polymorpha subsp. ruderalis]|uniref:Small VCP/p97-interacting protein n=1 Tax=Marchantia polymorpha TaxID=3197 RepID=A0A2R6X2U9_MARPO|nr:hypothetical protein MARPO_0040s0100 [Marchantia polymorpha]BBN03147.1 hypothetical protein Mp_2g21140 [Marchantia polymorpha subsp. ruderalis]|eukprot:PTQ40429.1 hypothetical protein MARPO_0040s0100 [Marchantia polymorpha]